MITETGQYPPDENLVALDLMDDTTAEALKEEILAAALRTVQERLDSADLMRRQAMEIYANLLERQTKSLADLVANTEAERLQLKESVRVLEVALDHAHAEIAVLEDRHRESVTQGLPKTHLETEMRDAMHRLEERNRTANFTIQTLRDELTAARDTLAIAEERIAKHEARIDEQLQHTAMLSRQLAQIQDQWEHLQASSST